jgi:hypothetical protein
MRRLSNKIRYFVAATAALCGLGQPLVARAETVWTASSDDALLFDARLDQYRLGEGVRGYQTPSGACLDFADVILALDLPIRLDKKLRRATGWALEESRTLTVDRENNMVQTMNRNEKIGSGMVYDTPEGWCVNSDALGKWLGITLTPDLSNALLFIKSDIKMPVELAAERRARAARVRPVSSFDLRSLPQANAPFRGVRTPSIDAIVSIGGLHSRTTNKIDRQFQLYATGEIGPVAYDARLASNNRGVPESLRVRAYRSDADGKLLGPLKATQVAIGDVSGFSTQLAAGTSTGRGAMVTNRPLERPDNFDKKTFRGELPVGWDAELYRNGELLAFAIDRADGRYEFPDVPLNYGQNRFEIVLYGPQGQIRREGQTVTVGLESIPPKTTWYAASINQDGRDLIGIGQGQNLGSGAWRGSISLERGINALTSLAVSAHSLGLRSVLRGQSAQVVRRNFADVSLRRAMGPALFEFSGSSDDRGGYAGRAAVLAQLGKTSFSAESTNAFAGYRSDRILNGVTGLHTVSAYHGFNIGRTILPLSVAARYTTRETGIDTIGIDTRASMRIGRYNVTNITSWRQDKREFGADPPSIIETNLLANARFGRVRLRGEAKFRLKPDSRFDSAALVAEWDGRGNGRHEANWRAELGYDPGSNRGRIGLGYIRRYEKFSMNANVEAATDGSVAAGLNLAFSIGPDPRAGGGLRVSSSRLASQGQALVSVFRDLNGDGVRQADESGVKDVELTAGRTVVDGKTDENGQMIVDDLGVFQPVLIGIDTSSLVDPLVQPSSPGVVVTPRPGVSVALDLPLVSAGEVDGTLVKQGGGTLEGVDLELVNAAGVVIGRTRSDFDGFFIFESVPYGKYSVRIAQLSADAARLKVALVGNVAVDDATPSSHLDTVAAQSSETQTAAE